MTLENDEQTNQATPSPSYEKEDIKNYEKNEKGIACDDEDSRNFHGIRKGTNYT